MARRTREAPANQRGGNQTLTWEPPSSINSPASAAVQPQCLLFHASLCVEPNPRSSASAAVRSSSTTRPDLSRKDRQASASGSHANEEDGGADGNSDAETIVLPGKDGHSPSKVRKIIKYEDKSDGEDTSTSMGRKRINGKQDRDTEICDRGDDRGEMAEKTVSVAGNAANEGSSSLAPKKKKHSDKSKTKDGSSGLSSAPASPPQRRRRPSVAHSSSNTHSKSDSETAHVESPRMSTKEKPKSLDKLIPHKRKAAKAESDDEAESRKARRQRTSGSGLDASRKQHSSAKSHHETHARTRSVSPPARVHRRSVSTQLTGHSSNGLGHKKKRIPAPLQSTDYHSDESSASGSPHLRSSKLRSLTTPATAESAISPAKLVPHKKHLDAHGQTFLARACAKGEYETAKQRLQERPEDINVADYAGNTPLQISALNGFDDIVKLLVDAGCNLDCVNNDKDTPLLDAVENGHLEVVRILLAAGVNPRKANAYGQEPIDRVDSDSEHADEIKRALREAKQRIGERRRTSEDHHADFTDARSSHGPESPRRSPGASGSIHAAIGRRAGTVRSTKTSNHLLYMPMDDKTLRQAAARGDEETSMVAAARGGRANPDPAPISNNDHSTPMLAAIGQENIKVIKLLLDQNNFDPTRRFKGETYYEIARGRRGANWMEEEDMLKKAYDEYKKSHRSNSKNKSPSTREQERESRRSRADVKDETTKSHKRKVSSSPKEKKRSNSITGPGRPKKDDRIPTIAISDREASPAARPTVKAKRAESDLAAASSEGEAIKPRRKLISGRELKGEREKRRASMTPREDPEKGQKTEKLSVTGEASGKRHRLSATPPHPGRLKPNSPDDRHLKANTPRDSGLQPRKAEALPEHGRRESGKSSEEPDVEMDRKKQAEAESEAREAKRREEVKKREEAKREEEKRRKEDEEKERERLRLEEEARRRAEEEAKQRAEAEARRLEEERRRKEEERRRKEEEEERRRKDEEDRKQRERRRLEEEETKRREEERKRKEQEEEERRRREKEEEERKRREEEARLRKEQLEQRELREELERRQAAERAAREVEQRRIRLEQERIRVAKLPPLLRWLDGAANCKAPEVAEKFSTMQGVRYDCIRPEATGSPDGREQWLLNTQVALLLGDKDLELSRYAAWTKLPVSLIAKRVIWRLESDRYALTSPNLYELGKQLPGYYGRDDPERMGYRAIERLRGEAWEKFAAMEMFFVKASDFLHLVPTVQHLHDIRLTMSYRELPEDEAQLSKWVPLQKWKSDPDANRFYGFAPSNKHFVNGELLAEDKPGLCAVSRSPFQEKKVPRRGLVAVGPDDPSYNGLCQEQGLEDMGGSPDTSFLPNGAHSSSPVSASSRGTTTTTAPVTNGVRSPRLQHATAANGNSLGQRHGSQPISPSSESGPAQARPLVNGIHGMTNGTGS
ncbi:ankyrin repeat protein [Podospora appendiculata]|uniref:Ankyrin repeat protein n=1 Tax=Podospora appendiculata TaxID=314037 RepID=A0AAE1CFX4_9PEZI|nr:ankyrin repeat protein [Podospora appendiculata]